MNATISWLHVGDLHIDANERNADGKSVPWASLGSLQSIVGEVGDHIGDGVDFVFLPGDIANYGAKAEYARLMPVLQQVTDLGMAWFAIPGDHDFAERDHHIPRRALKAYLKAIPEANRPRQQVIAGHRCIFLDIVSAGTGGPDFRLSMGERNRIAEQIAIAEACSEVPLVFMHAYPGDLAADGDEVARRFADGGVAFVDTGHTHFNELLNDGHVVYGATRSTGQIDEGDRRPGYSIVCVQDRVPSWRFRRIGDDWPHVQIVAPCDRRLVTRPFDPLQVPRPGTVVVVAKLLGAPAGAAVSATVAGTTIPMQRDPDGLWRAQTRIVAGLNRVRVDCAGRYDEIELVVAPFDQIPKRRPPVALGNECHAIGAWPIAAIDGAQLGPNKNGRAW